MSLTLAALVLSSLSPATPVASTALAQGKVEIIKGKKGTVKAAGTNSEGTSVRVAPEAQGNTGQAQELDRKSAELDAKHRDLSQREQALQEKETAAADAEKKKADQQKAMQKHIEKVGEQNDQLWQQSTDSLAGD